MQPKKTKGWFQGLFKDFPGSIKNFKNHLSIFLTEIKHFHRQEQLLFKTSSLKCSIFSQTFTPHFNYLFTIVHIKKRKGFSARMPSILRLQTLLPLCPKAPPFFQTSFNNIFIDLRAPEKFSFQLLIVTDFVIKLPKMAKTAILFQRFWKKWFMWKFTQHAEKW